MATFWHSRWSAPAPDHPHELTVDLGRMLDVTAITYLPRQDKPVPDGMIEEGRVETSPDGNSWSTAGDFHFGNLVNDPVERTYDFPAVAEFGVLTAPSR